MSRIRLNSSISVERTASGIHLRHHSHSLRINARELGLRPQEIIPLLDGTRDRNEIVSSVKRHLRRRVLEFLNTLEQNGFLDHVVDRKPHFLKRQKHSEYNGISNYLGELIGCLDKYQNLHAKWADERTGILRYLITEPPNSSQFKSVWTSAATLRRSMAAKERSLKATAFGAGISSVEAITKALGEALELYAAGECAEHDLRYSAASSLDGEFLDPRALSLYSQAQYKTPSFPYEPFHLRKRLAWTRGRWLDTGADVWLPAFLTYFGAMPTLDQSYAEVTTSGLAAGTSLADASMRAICELIERDAFMITWLARLPAQRLIPDVIDDGTRNVEAEFATHGMEIRTYLLNTGIAVPVVLSLIFGDGKNWPGAIVGLGAHADPIAATQSAMLELALMAPALRSEMLQNKRRFPRRADQVKTPLDHALFYVPKRRARAFDFLEKENAAAVLLSDLPRPDRINLSFYRTRLADAEVRVALKNLTPKIVADDRSFRVVRALGTNLQPLHFGFGRERTTTKRLRTLAKHNKLSLLPHPLA